MFPTPLNWPVSYPVPGGIDYLWVGGLDMSVPRVVRLARRGGALLQGCDCYIGRAVTRGGWNLNASIWANPFKRQQNFPPGSTLSAYEQHVRSSPFLMYEIPSLAGKTLGCWCKPNPCHGDVLAKLVKEHFETEEFEVLPDVDVDVVNSEEDSKYTMPPTLPEGEFTEKEGITIGATYMRYPYLCIMAISGGRLIRPLLKNGITKSNDLATIGTRFRFTIDKEQVCTGLPHSYQDVHVNVTQKDPKPVSPKQLHQVISLCALSKLHAEDSRNLVEVLASSQVDSRKTPYVFEGVNVHSSFIAKADSDVVFYHTAEAKKLRAQVHVFGKEFHLPVTSVAVTEMILKSKTIQCTLKLGNVDFIRVSLARPFLPWQSHHLDKPCCYAMLTGVILSKDNNITIM